MGKENCVTIITYHYVRDLKNSRYPSIKGLETDLFRNQIEYIVKEYEVITMERLIDSVYITPSLNPNKKYALLAFDDGYIDHYTNVFPILKEFGIQGSFFIPVKAITEATVLDVNKIHFMLASKSITGEVIEKEILDDIIKFIFDNKERHNLLPIQDYIDKFSEKNRFDNDNVMLVKRLLQKGLPISVRNNLVNDLFEKYVEVDETAFSRELYMSIDQIKLMKEAGMYIGGHTYNHYHLGAQTTEEQEIEIKKSADFLKMIECDENYFTLSYPFGSFNKQTKELLKNIFCFKFGIGVKYGIFNINTDDCFDVPRIDCNDVSKKIINKII